MNNARYVQIAEEYIPENFPIRELRAEYRRQARKGDVFYPLVTEHEGEWIVSLDNAEGRPYAVVAFKA